LYSEGAHVDPIQLDIVWSTGDKVLAEGHNRFDALCKLQIQPEFDIRYVGGAIGQTDWSKTLYKTFRTEKERYNWEIANNQWVIFGDPAQVLPSR